MRKALAIIMALLVAICACGCRSSGEPEHEAYAISMSLDATDDGLLTVGVQVPTLGAGDSSDESSGKSSYQTYTATCETFPQAVDLLMATIPARLVLAHLKSIIVSESLARSPRFGILVSDMIQTYQLYGSSSLIVCRDKALDFIKAQKPAIGKRFSTSFTATIEHYADMGYVPMTTLYEAYAAMHGIYSDPILAYAATANENSAEPTGSSDKEAKLYGLGEKSPDASSIPGMGEAGALARTGPDESEFMGCAITRDGSVAGVLNGYETALLSFICGRVDTISYYQRDIAMRIKPDGPIRFTADCSGAEPRISLRMSVYVSSISEITDMASIEKGLAEEAARLIEKAQSLGVEPFGLAERAAGQFLTIDDFLQYGFRDKFCRASISVSVSAEKEKGE